MSIVVLLTVEENGNCNLQEESDPVNYAGPLMVLWPIRTIILKIMWDFSGVQWLRLCASTAGGTGSIPGWRTKILHASPCGQRVEKKKIV